jgi:hypothetical protein
VRSKKQRATAIAIAIVIDGAALLFFFEFWMDLFLNKKAKL